MKLDVLPNELLRNPITHLVMITKEDSIELTRRARSIGMSVIEIAKLLGISRDTVYKRLKVQVQQHSRLKIHDRIQKELQNLLLKNPTHGVRNLASELGTSKSTVQRSIKTLGFTSKQLSLRFADRKQLNLIFGV